MHTAPPPWGPRPRCPRWALSAATQTSFPRQQSEAHPQLRSHSHAKPRKISNKRHPPSTSLGPGSDSGVPEVLARAPGLPTLDTALHKAPGCGPLAALRGASGQKGQDKHTTPRKPLTLTCILGPTDPPHSSGLSGRLRRPVRRSQVFSPERTSRGPQVHVQPIHRPLQQEIFSFELSGGLPWGGPGPGSRLTVGAGKAKRNMCGLELPGQQVRAPQGGGQGRMPRTRPRMRAAAERTGAPREPLQEPPAGRTLAAGALGRPRAWVTCSRQEPPWAEKQLETAAALSPRLCWAATGRSWGRGAASTSASPHLLPCICSVAGTYILLLPASAGDVRDCVMVPGSGISPGGGNCNPLQYSHLGNPMDRGAWRTTVPGVAVSDRTECMHTHMHTFSLSLSLWKACEFKELA